MPFVKKIAALVLLCMALANGKAQSPILTYTTTYISTSTAVSNYSNKPAVNSGSFNGCGGSNFTYGFNRGTDNALRLLNFIAGGKSYFIANNTAAKVVLRRANNASVNGRRTVVSFESAFPSPSPCPSSGVVEVRLPYQDTMENFLNNNYINQGTDNIFTNVGNGDGNNNNIERVDILFPAGLSSSNTTDAGFAIFDRGNNNSHDGLRIAVITSLDANGDPASFGTVKTSLKGNGSNNGSWGHPSIANGNKSMSFYVMRKEGNETRLRASAAVLNQEIGGVFFSFSDLGVAASQKIYGYAVLSTDGIANPTSAQLLNINNTAVYPTNTTESAGGLDMMAINAVFSSGGNPLAVTEALLQGTTHNNKIVLDWQVVNLLPGTSIDLERSETGGNYSLVYHVPVQDMAARSSYTQTLTTSYFYRLKIQPASGLPYYSNVVKAGPRQKTLSVYPNLVKGNESIIVEGLPDGVYKARFAAVEGQAYSIELQVQGGRALLAHPSHARFKGIVWVNFTDCNGHNYPGGKLVFL
jgi:hypothetical protein